MFSAPHHHPRENQSYITHSLHVFHFIVSALMRGDAGRLHMTVRWTKVCVLIHPKPKQHVDSERPKTHRENVCPNLFGSKAGGKKKKKATRKKRKHSLAVDPEEALSTRIGAAEYFIAGTVFRLTEALMRNNWKSKPSDWRRGRVATGGLLSAWKPQSASRRLPLHQQTESAGFHRPNKQIIIWNYFLGVVLSRRDCTANQ